MLRASLINGIGINLDADISKHIETLTDPGVFDGFIVANNNTISPGKAWVQATRTNGETVFVYVEMKSEFSFSLTDGKIWLEIGQEAIDNGLLNNEDWSGIASIKTWLTLPSQNFLLIASVTAGQVKDERNLIPKIQSVATRTTTLESKVEKSEKKIEKLEESGASSCLEYVWIFGDKEARTPASPDFVRQKLPLYEVCELELNLGKDAADKEIHIQRLSSGIPSDETSFKIKKVQLPITNIEVEVRKGIVVDVDTENCYWYGGELLASGTITKNQLFTGFWKISVKLNKKIGLPKGGLYSIVLRQAGGVVNAANYYQIGCDMTQRSTAFGAVKVNGGTRTPTKWMPFCESDAFLEEAIVHYRTKNDEPILTINSQWLGRRSCWFFLSYRQSLSEFRDFGLICLRTQWYLTYSRWENHCGW